MRVLGIDPGLTRCGLAVIEGQPGTALRMVAVGVARTQPSVELGQRLVTLESHIEQQLSLYQPDLVAVERVFSQHNVRTVMGTAQASGVAICCAARRGIAVGLHTPSEVKAAVSGNGRADKDQVATMVMRLLGLTTRPEPADATDALALAICAVWRGATHNRLVQAAAASAGRFSTRRG